MKKPSMDEWLKKAKADEHAANCGMYLFHNRHSAWWNDGY